MSQNVWLKDNLIKLESMCNFLSFAFAFSNLYPNQATQNRRIHECIHVCFSVAFF